MTEDADLAVPGELPIIDESIPNASRMSVFHREPSTTRSPFVVADALVWSLMCSEPRLSVHATQVSIVPMHTSRSAMPGVLASSHAALVAA